MARIVILMGVSGSGKSTAAEILTQKWGGQYFDGDDFHPPSNVAKMRSGTPLTDADRKKWMTRLQKLIVKRQGAEEDTYIACSALRRAFRDGLRTVEPDLWFVHLTGNFKLIQGRLQKRKGHYMPASLLESQFAALEEPTPEEPNVVPVEVKGAASVVAGRIAKALDLGKPKTKAR